MRVRGADARHRRRRASTSRIHKRQRGKSAGRRAAGRAGAACCATCRSRSRCTGTRSSTTAGASCCSAGRSAGCCSSTAGASCRSRSAAPRTPPGPQVQDVESGALTYGHRFLATSGRAGRSIKVRSFDEYQARLAEHFVVLEHAERRDRIARELEIARAAARRPRASCKEHARADRGGRRPRRVSRRRRRVLSTAAFLALPQEVLTTTLVHHQHYFPVVDETGELKEAFLAVVNTQPADERVIAKNAERVVDGAAARREVLLGRGPQGAARVAARPAAHAAVPQEARQLPRQGRADRGAGRVDRARGVRAARRRGARGARRRGWPRRTSTTDMVFEFPELQGTMGGIYAREEGQPEAGLEGDLLPLPADRRRGRRAAVAAAARRGGGRRGRRCRSPTSSTRSSGCSTAGERATGSRDPFGLRRQMHGRRAAS